MEISIVAGEGTQFTITHNFLGFLVSVEQLFCSSLKEWEERWPYSSSVNTVGHDVSQFPHL